MLPAIAAVGAVAGLVVVLLALLAVRRRRQKQKQRARAPGMVVGHGLAALSQNPNVTLSRTKVDNPAYLETDLDDDGGNGSGGTFLARVDGYAEVSPDGTLYSVPNAGAASRGSRGGAEGGYASPYYTVAPLSAPPYYTVPPPAAPARLGPGSNPFVRSRLGRTPGAPESNYYTEPQLYSSQLYHLASSTDGGPASSNVAVPGAVAAESEDADGGCGFYAVPLRYDGPSSSSEMGSSDAVVYTSASRGGAGPIHAYASADVGPQTGYEVPMFNANAADAAADAAAADAGYVQPQTGDYSSPFVGGGGGGVAAALYDNPDEFGFANDEVSYDTPTLVEPQRVTRS